MKITQEVYYMRPYKLYTGLIVYLFFQAFFLHTALPLKVLHISFHKGCIREFEAISRSLELDLTSWLIPELPSHFLDPQSTGHVLYNVGHDRAKRIWDKHKRTFNTFDVIVVSDTAPLSRIFLQNNFQKGLLIWISDRFDYCDQETLDCQFPDKEYYDLFNTAKCRPNVTVVANSPFEHFYAKLKGVDTGPLVIKPCASFIEEPSDRKIPASVKKSETFFLPCYHNETIFMNLQEKCQKLRINCYMGPFTSPRELEEFKGIIHLPYSWSTIAFFVNSELKLPYFVPSKQFLLKLQKQGNYWHQNEAFLFKERRFDLSEWYSSENQSIITYFDSWKDLKKKIAKVKTNELSRKIAKFSFAHKQEMLLRWKLVFDNIQNYLKNTSEH